ncbi:MULTISPECIES: lipocalin-like domain-containing protein [Halomonadaceae]|uniref:lipocalin-like domain-containing protein n=1 Tax=Halomonadaceae TaxID=28256 RepID=UPI0012F17A8F|nr:MULTISPECIES: lipocalin-like domain-containing protein [Halomonas]UEQ05788.1 iron ABC transporter permease [Halomonas profundus]CAD5264265.1 Iron ABC transporter permease [Halomonas sp. 156]CAD5265433.1 AttH component of AttEFGH ABC transport system [Halomonas sp. I3]CAD5284369.1 Iron ABC transporter permease [Halomonas sp. 113]CAD5285862.1 Iron ABC transporter permease [Halomonas sp. 59]
MSLRLRLTLHLLLIATVALTLYGCDEENQTETNNTGFAGLGQDADGFRHAEPNQPLSFPQEHAAHPDYRIEWWYLTANLEDADGEPLGLQWTLFRQALMPPNERPAPTPWAADQLWMAHMAISQGEQHQVAERFGRSHSQASLNTPQDSQAGVMISPFHAWLDDWQLKANEEADSSDFNHLTLTAYSGEGASRFGYRLELTAEGPLVLHGEQGFSQKAANGQGSMYYSQPFWRINGEVTINGETKTVSGRGWLDREWSSQLLDARQSGWDWFSIHLNDGHKLMAFQLRGGSAQNADYRSGTWITPQGDATPLASDDITLTPLATSAVAGRNVPTQWRLEIPSVGIDINIEAPHANRWMTTSVPYWEGEVVVNDLASGEPLGEGYLEMTGY